MVRQKRVHFLGRRRQTRQVQRRAANERELVGGRRRFQTVLFKPRENESIDIGLRPRRIFHRRWRRRVQRLERPIRAMLIGDDHARRRGGGFRCRPRCAGLDPLHERVDVLVLELGAAARHFRRAGEVFHGLNHQALVRVARHERRARVATLEHGLARIETKTVLRLLGVALEARRHEQRPHARLEKLRRRRLRHRRLLTAWPEAPS
jgi:hypothetical protein